MATLDENGCFEGLPFMPEMARYAGRRFTVSRTSTAICVEGFPGLRRLPDAVILDGLRCDGSAHDGCQRACTMLWKTEWLRPPSEHPSEAEFDQEMVDDLPTREGDRYFCQSTQLATATNPIPRFSLRPMIEDVRRGELTVARFVHIAFLAFVGHLLELVRGRGLEPAGEQRRTSRGALELEAGDVVRIKDRVDIEATLTPGGLNQGLAFEYEMFDHCGDECGVTFPVERIILEETGQMLEIKNSVVLGNLACSGLRRRNCPRANYFYWRESWLERVERTGE